MITVEIKRENGEVIKMNGNAAVSIIIGPEDSKAVSEVTMAGVTNPQDTMRAIADTAASLLEAMCKDDEMGKAYIATVLLRRLERNLFMSEAEKEKVYETKRADITPAE